MRTAIRRLVPAVAVTAAVAALATGAAAWSTVVQMTPVDKGVSSSSGDAAPVVITPSGAEMMAWTQYPDSGSVNSVWVRTRTATGAWADAQDISDGHGTRWNELLGAAMNDDGVAAVAWLTGQNTDRTLQVSIRGSAGGTWSREEIASTGVENWPQLGISSAGAITAVWAEISYLTGGPDALKVAERPAGGSWPGGGLTLASVADATEERIRYPQLAVNADGDAALAWVLCKNASVGCSINEVYALTRPAGGSWTPADAQQLNGAGENAQNVRVGIDAAGDAFVTWTTDQSGSGTVKMARKPVGVAWTGSEDVSTVGDTAVNGVQNLAVNAAGAVVVGWKDGTTYAPWVRLRTAAGVWQAPVQVDSFGAPAAGGQGTWVAIDDAGVATAMWGWTPDGSASDPLYTTDVGLRTIAMDGTLGTPRIIAVADTPGTIVDPTYNTELFGFDLAGNGAGAVIAGLDRDNNGMDTYYAISSRGDGPAVTVPDAPTAVRASAGSTQASVSWTAPASDGGAAIDQYAVTSSPGSKTCTATAPKLTCVVKGLTNGTRYTFTVKAHNSAGWGAASAASAEVTPKAATMSVTKAKVVKKKSSYSTTAKVSGAGKVVQRATYVAKVKGRKKTITACTLKKTATKAGSLKLTCKLNAKARKALKRAKLKLTITTTFTPVGGKSISKKQTVVFQRKR